MQRRYIVSVQVCRLTFPLEHIEMGDSHHGKDLRLAKRIFSLFFGFCFAFNLEMSFSSSALLLSDKGSGSQIQFKCIY